MQALEKNTIRAALRGSVIVPMITPVQADRSLDLAGIFQQGRSLPQQIPALKACAAALGLCERYVLPPLLAAGAADCGALSAQLRTHGLLP